MIVTIDGPAGTGKSTAARGLAERLGFDFLDTGAMYRALGWACLEAGVDPADADAAARIAETTAIEFRDDRTWVGDLDVTEAIRTSPVSQAASLVAQIPAVRRELVRQQRRLADGRRIVCEGRDQGTVAFPEAECKFFITADPEERARRRQGELLAKGVSVDLKELLAEQKARDRRDETRAEAPLVPADDAIGIDTTSMTGGEVLDMLERHVRSRMTGEN
ncbi:MAG: (d)CMP kinase [Planctomycetota bacterium]|nr:MAG: (d)CMP kinase [Planctomycetota bacterium]